MKKYYIYCSTQYFKNSYGKFIRESDTTGNPNDEYIGSYDSYDEAIKIYNKIDLQLLEDRQGICADYKELYEYDTDDISTEDVEDGNFNIDKMNLLEEEYTKTE